MASRSRSRGWWLLVAICSVVSVRAADAENASLARRFPEDPKSILLKRSDWRPFPRASERAAWTAIPRDARDRIMALGEEFVDQDIPNLPATLYLGYRRTGNRSHYQNS